jgi:N-acetylglucosaminyldiphosphoundecaprenol N-acetyl-beta-D-mannosaminyltransferase
MSKYSARINATLLGVGGAFPVYAGSVARAPAWMQRSSLEWLYRLGKEPFRLFGRYFLTNSYFLFRIFFEIIGYRLGIKRN